ncbi:DUF6461 domain-containing protein [Streptosporangium canum]|uniref:DUF6461 domain-containing protein n=1 Tax=Streptosporangium canum TaxID=324952 RepID=UPI00341215B7
MYGSHASWAQLDDHMCVTWISGATPDDVVRALGADSIELVHPRTVTVQEEAENVFIEEPGGGCLLIRRHESWVIALEIKSRRGADYATLTTLSQQGKAINITAGRPGTQLTYAVDGQVVQMFDADELSEDDLTDEPDIRQAHRWAQSFGIEPQEWAEHAKAAVFNLAEAITGMEMDDSWVTGGWTAVRLLPEPRSATHVPVSLPYAEMRQLAERNSQIRSFVEKPSIEQIPAMIHMLAHIAVATVGLSAPVVDAALAAFDSRPAEQEVQRLQVELTALADQFRMEAWNRAPGTIRETDPIIDTLYRKQDAALAVAAALNDDSMSAFNDVARHARTTKLRRDNDDYLMLETLDICYRHILKSFM